MKNSLAHPTLMQDQFGRHAEDYVHSSDHAQGKSLDRLVDLMKGFPASRALDLATGGGHTALALSSLVYGVIASDVTFSMLIAARRFIESRSNAQMFFIQADAQHIPFQGLSFDLVTCRFAPHHFPDPVGFVRECARLTRPGGYVAVIDTISPPDPLTARYINAYEKLRDPSHHRNHSAPDWRSMFIAAGLEIKYLEHYSKPVAFDNYCGRMGVYEQHRTQLRVMLLRAPAAAYSWLRPREPDGQLTFDLGEILIVGRTPPG